MAEIDWAVRTMNSANESQPFIARSAALVHWAVRTMNSRDQSWPSVPDRAGVDRFRFSFTEHIARVGRSIFDLRPMLRHVVFFAVKVYKIPVGFIFQLKIQINFEIEYLFHINSFSGISSFCNSVMHSSLI